MPIIVRSLLYDDAAAYTDLLRILAVESKYPVVNLIERGMSAADWRRQIRDMGEQGTRAIFVAANGDELVGFLSANVEWFAMRQARIVIGIREAFTSQGIGTRLFEVMELWARTTGIGRLHLTVERSNQRAQGLYHKMGFAVVGMIPKAVRIGNEWEDDFVMEKWLIEAAE